MKNTLNKIDKLFLELLGCNPFGIFFWIFHGIIDLSIFLSKLIEENNFENELNLYNRQFTNFYTD